MTDNVTERSIETDFEINAPLEAVWKALTNAEELANWFPIEARINPGVGGNMWMSWGEGPGYDTPIAAWEENKHLKLIYVDKTPPEKEKEAREQGFYIPFQVAIDYYLEAKGDGTVLRLVHSGFSSEASWDTQYNGTVRGWAFELRGLKHYLEHHLGTRRHVVHAKKVINDVPIEEAWQRLMSSDGLLASGSIEGLKVGDSCSFTTATGDELRGTVQIFNPPRDLCATATNHNNALLRLRVDEGCITSPDREVNLWLSTFGLDESETSGLQKRWDAMLGSLFTPAAKS